MMATDQEQDIRQTTTGRNENTTRDYSFRSKELTGPIAELGFMRRSLLFAELACVAYEEEDSAAEEVAPIGLKETLFIECDGSQAYVFRTETDTIVACRGTEPNEWNDIKADVNAMFAVAETVGRVHRGFKREVDDLWPELEKELQTSDTLWFTGHSLGGAMATICASRCFLSTIPANPRELYTFGSPRVGDNKYVNFVNVKHYRFVNNNDVVTRVPPAWMGYRHTGELVYFDSNGDLKQMTKAQRARDRWRGFTAGLRKWKIDHFADHSMRLYVDSMYRAVVEEEEIARRAAGVYGV